MINSVQNNRVNIVSMKKNNNTVQEIYTVKLVALNNI